MVPSPAALPPCPQHHKKDFQLGIKHRNSNPLEKLNWYYRKENHIPWRVIVNLHTNMNGFNYKPNCEVF